MKIALVCSAGGHLVELQQLRKVYSKHDHFFVTIKHDYISSEKTHFVQDPKRNPLSLLRSLFQELSILLKEKPDVVLTTGAGVAVPFCYLAKIFGKRVIFLESLGRITSPSISGKAVYPIADLFLVQWRSLLKSYPKAVYAGTVL